MVEIFVIYRDGVPFQLEMGSDLELRLQDLGVDCTKFLVCSTDKSLIDAAALVIPDALDADGDMGLEVRSCLLMLR